MEHERELQAALAERDAEALEALRLLDQHHKTNKSSSDGMKYQNRDIDGKSRREVSVARGYKHHVAGASLGQTSPRVSNSSGSDNDSVSEMGGSTLRKSTAPYSGAVAHAATVRDTASSRRVDDAHTTDGNSNSSASGYKRRDRRRPRPSSTQSRSRNDSISLSSTPPQRRSGSTEATAGGRAKGGVSPSAALIEAEAAARDEALREARVESDRLEGEIESSPGGYSERSPSMSSESYATPSRSGVATAVDMAVRNSTEGVGRLGRHQPDTASLLFAFLRSISAT